MKAASWRRKNRIRQITRNWCNSTASLSRHRVHQSARIRVRGMTPKAAMQTALDDAAQIHDGNRIGNVANYAEVM